jgi:ribulose-phosphate 3-epimerase
MIWSPLLLGLLSGFIFLCRMVAWFPRSPSVLLSLMLVVLTSFPTNTVFDVKLGCIEPEARMDDFIKAGADILSVHPEATLQLGAVINRIADAGVAPGVVLNPGTSISAVEHVLDQCRVAVVMLVSLPKSL